jgi:peptidoglycan hydrolase-like protein with peptidoglycan-binding domain
LSVEPIKSVQYLLLQHGHTNVAVDGIFGPITATAVRDFQIAHGLLVDGVVGNRPGRH